MALVGRKEESPWVRVQTAQAMAMSRKLGIADMIDSVCDVEHRTITPGDTFELMAGAIAARSEHVAMYNIRGFYDGAPLEALLGKPVDPENLNATSLSRNLEAIGSVRDKERLMWEISRKAEKVYGLSSNVLHGDGTCFRFTGDPKEDVFADHIAVPKHGHPKVAGDGKYLQYNAYGIADDNRVLRTTRPYDGNVADEIMNRDALDFLEAVEDVKKIVFVADCKLASAAILDRMDDMEMGYVTKIPDNSIDDARMKALWASVPDLHLDEDDGHIRRYADVDVFVHGKCRRFVIVVNMVKFRDVRSRIRTKTMSDLRTAAEKLSKKTFDSRDEALALSRDRIGRLKPAGITVRYGIEEKSVRVKPHQGPDAFREEYKTVFSPKVEIVDDDESVQMASLMAAGTVLITNLGKSPSEDGDVRKGATPEKILGLYNGQFACEHSYRLMKSGLGLDCIYLQNPLRVDGMLFIVSLVAMLFTLMDAVLRGRHLKTGATVYRMRVELQNSRLVHTGSDWMFEGPPDKMDMFLERLSIFGIDPDSFLDPRQ